MRTQLVFILACAAVLAACDSGYSTGVSGGGTTGTDTVHVTNDKFTPTAVTPDSTGTVVWTWNTGGTAHNVTFQDSIPGSGDKTSGTFSQVFSTDGTYRFRCTIHSTSFFNGMSGRVVVGAAAEPPDPPDPY